MGFSGGSVVKNLPAMKETAFNAGDVGSIPGSGRSPGEENGDPLQYFYLENSMNRRAWQGYSPWVHKSQTRLNE